MTPGINILAEYTAGGMPVGAVVILSLLSLFGLIVSVLLTIDDSPGKAIAFGFATGFAVVAIILGVSAEPEHTQYKVTISDDVHLIDFLEKYEILDVEGDIYTIREVTEE